MRWQQPLSSALLFPSRKHLPTRPSWLWPRPRPTSAQADIILTTEGTRLHHTLAANITIFPAMSGIPVVGTGGTIPKMNGIGRRTMPHDWRAPCDGAMLQRPLPDDALKMVARRRKIAQLPKGLLGESG
jgi:hypothetical protein